MNNKGILGAFLAVSLVSVMSSAASVGAINTST